MIIMIITGSTIYQLVDFWTIVSGSVWPSQFGWLGWLGKRWCDPLRPVKVHLPQLFCDCWSGSSKWYILRHYECFAQRWGTPQFVAHVSWENDDWAVHVDLGSTHFSSKDEQSKRWCELCVVRFALRCQLSMPKLAPDPSSKNVSKHVKTTKMRKISQLMDQDF